MLRVLAGMCRNQAVLLFQLPGKLLPLQSEQAEIPTRKNRQPYIYKVCIYIYICMIIYKS